MLCMINCYFLLWGWMCGLNNWCVIRCVILWVMVCFRKCLWFLWYSWGLKCSRFLLRWVILVFWLCRWKLMVGWGKLCWKKCLVC